jgi:hypothetical protein
MRVHVINWEEAYLFMLMVSVEGYFPKLQKHAEFSNIWLERPWALTAEHVHHLQSQPLDGKSCFTGFPG